MLRDLEDKLQQANNRFTAQQLWNSYAIVAPEQVRRATKQDELKAITNLIQLVRYAFHQTERLETLVSTANQYFNLWLGQNQRALTPAQREIMAKIVDYVAYNGACSVKDITKDSRERGVKLIRAFGNDINQANEALQSMFSFVVFRKTA